MVLSIADLSIPLFLINHNESPPTIDLEFTNEGRPVVYNGWLKSDLVGGIRKERQVIHLPGDQADPDILAIFKTAFVEYYFPRVLKQSGFTLVQAHELPPGIQKAD